MSRRRQLKMANRITECPVRFWRQLASRARAAIVGRMKPQLALLLALCAAPLCAETLVVNDQVQLRESKIEVPQRGASMAAVEARFGAPRSRHEAVGKPPITRWDYEGFSVYFEYQHVVHAVVQGG